MGYTKQTLIFYSNGDVAKRIDGELYKPLTKLFINAQLYEIADMYDEFEANSNYLIRKIHLS